MKIQIAETLLERYFGLSKVVIDGKEVLVHYGTMSKGDETLEVADFVINAAGGQAHSNITRCPPQIRKDFAAVFQANPLRSSYIHVTGASET